MDKYIHRIRSLFAKADSTSFAAEAEACRRKARQLMEAHGITEQMLVPKPSPRPVPVFYYGNGFNYSATSTSINYTGGNTVYINIRFY